MIVLIITGVNTMMGSNGYNSKGVQSSALYIGPLFIILWSIIRFEKRRFRYYPSVIVLTLGFLLEFEYHSSNDPSLGIILMINFLANWIFGIATLFHEPRRLKNEKDDLDTDLLGFLDSKKDK